MANREPKVHEIDGVTYVEVNRKAEVGEKLVIVKGFGWYRNEVGGIYTVIDGSQYGFRRESNDYVYVGHTSNDVDEIYCVMMSDYHVLEPAEEVTVDTSQASEQVIEMFAALSRKIVSLEQQLADTQRNVERQAEELENAKHRISKHVDRFGAVEEKVEMLTDDVITLDERSQILSAINKYYAEGSR